MKALLGYRASGQTPTDDDVMLSPQMKSSRKVWQAWAEGKTSNDGKGAPPVDAEQPKDPASTQGPDRFVGPKNPEHPHVNREPGGREDV
jgi:hypothetical protein